MRIAVSVGRVVALILASTVTIAFGNDAKTVFQKVSDSVVKVEVFAGSPSRAVATGSGIVLSNETVVTNCHVLARGDSHWVVVGDQRRSARITSGSTDLDLCLVQHDQLQGLRPVRVGRLSQAATGERVFAVGNPLGLDNTISEGIVSSIRRVDDVNLIQTTAPISPGSSGGGLFNSKGELIGVTTFQFRGQNLNFAVPADYVERVRKSAAIPVFQARQPTAGESQSTAISYKNIPFGLPLKEFSRIRPGCKCTEIPGLSVCNCYDETYFGTSASAGFFFREGSRLSAVIVSVPGVAGAPYQGDLMALFSEMRGEFGRAHAGPGDESNDVTKEGRYQVTVKWRVGTDERALVREHVGAAADSPVRKVAVALQRNGERIDRKDY